MTNTLFISPHNDDESLFGAYTLMREKPLVVIVTDGFIQAKRGDDVTWAERRSETIAAMSLVGCPVLFGGIPDDTVTPDFVASLLGRLFGFTKVYAPALQGGNAHHDMISLVARDIFRDVIQYTTYTKDELWTTGNKEIMPSPEEAMLKEQMLNCYQSQIRLPSTAPHFTAVRGGKSEWLLI